MSPPLPEQRKIAEILQTWDEAIEKLEAETTVKEKVHRSYVKRLVNDQQYKRQHLRGPFATRLEPQLWTENPKDSQRYELGWIRTC